MDNWFPSQLSECHPLPPSTPHPLPLPDGAAHEVTLWASLGKGAAAWRGLSFPTWRVGLCCLMLQGVPTGTLPEVQEPSLVPSDSGWSGRTGMGHGEGVAWPRPRPEPTAALTAPLPPSWVSGQRSLGRFGHLFLDTSAAAGSLKITPPWAWAMTVPS